MVRSKIDHSDTPRVNVPGKYSEALALGICKLVEEVGFLAIAAERMGVSRTAAYRWKRLGDEGDQEYEGFAIGVAQARAKWTSKQLKLVKNPQWLLEKMEPDLFGRSDPATTVVNVQQNATVLSREQALSELKALAKSDPELLKLLEENEK
jgi:hypothetical protein